MCKRFVEITLVKDKEERKRKWGDPSDLRRGLTPVKERGRKDQVGNVSSCNTVPRKAYGVKKPSVKEDTCPTEMGMEVSPPFSVTSWEQHAGSLVPKQMQRGTQSVAAEVSSNYTCSGHLSSELSW